MKYVIRDYRDIRSSPGGSQVADGEWIFVSLNNKLIVSR